MPINLQLNAVQYKQTMTMNTKKYLNYTQIPRTRLHFLTHDSTQNRMVIGNWILSSCKPHRAISGCTQSQVNTH